MGSCPEKQRRGGVHLCRSTPIRGRAPSCFGRNVGAPLIPTTSAIAHRRRRRPAAATHSPGGGRRASGGPTRTHPPRPAPATPAPDTPPPPSRPDTAAADPVDRVDLPTRHPATPATPSTGLEKSGRAEMLAAVLAAFTTPCDRVGVLPWPAPDPTRADPATRRRTSPACARRRRRRSTRARVRPGRDRAAGRIPTLLDLSARHGSRRCDHPARPGRSQRHGPRATRERSAADEPPLNRTPGSATTDQRGAARPHRLDLIITGAEPDHVDEHHRTAGRPGRGPPAAARAAPWSRSPTVTTPPGALVDPGGAAGDRGAERRPALPPTHRRPDRPPQPDPRAGHG